MPFKFNFGQAADAGHALSVPEAAEALPAQEVHPEGAPLVCSWDNVVAGGFGILKGRLRAEQHQALIVGTDTSDSDIVPGKYEGGLKLWEGGVDLAGYVVERFVQGNEAAPLQAGADQLPPSLQGLRVLELGCGHGLPGIAALAAHAEVHFQDFNAEVLNVLTSANVDCNWSSWQRRQQGCGAAAVPQSTGPEQPQAGSGPCPAPARYFAGSWAVLPSLLSSLELAGRYDLVLTAETIYNPSDVADLLLCIKRCLRRPSGTALLSAKSYYFGVGGGTAAFCQLVEEDGEMFAQRVRVLGGDGHSNRRELLQLVWRTDCTS